MLWIGNFCANSAQWLQLLTVGWLVRELTAGSSSSALLVVTVGGINTLPGLLVGPWAGVLGDRVDRRKLLMATEALMAGLAFLFALLVLSDRVVVWHAYVYVLISGIGFSITHPMGQGLIANTVPRHALTNAYAINVFTITGTRFIGPFFGGVLIATLGFFWNFTIEALLYIGMVLALLPMRTPYYKRRPIADGESPLSNLVEGVRYIWREERAIFLLIVLSLLPNVVLHPVVFLLPVFTADVLGLGPDVGGYLLAATGFGGLVSTVIIASVGFGLRKGMVCLVAVAVSSVCVVLFAQMQWLAPAILMIGLMSYSQATFRTGSGTLIQTLSPDRLRMRITSLQQYPRGLVVPASLAIGWLVSTTSVPTALTAVGAITLALALVSLAAMRRVRALV